MSLSVHPDQIVAESTNGLLANHASWDRIRVGEIAEVKNGFAFPSKSFNTRGEGVPLIRIRDVGSQESGTSYDGGFSPEYWIEPGDLIIGMDGDFRLARWKGSRSLLNQRVCRLRVTKPHLYDDRFLEHVLPGYLDAIHERTSSVTVKHLSSRTVEQIPVPLPSRTEQSRIVEMIEEQFSRLGAGVESLQRAKRNLALLRRSLLEEAESTARLAGPLRRVDEVATVQLGRQRSPKHHAGSHMRPYLRAANVTWDGVSLHDVMVMNFPPEDFVRFQLATGDILLNEASGSLNEVGKPAIWDGSVADMCFQNTLLRVKPHNFADRRFLHLMFLVAARTGGFARAARGVNIMHLGKAGLASWRVPVPALDEQQRIVGQIETQFSLCDSVGRTIDARLRQTSLLRQSILSRAFAGQFSSA